MPELTPEQKEHLKITHRANLRIDETWQLFNLYLSHDKAPGEALRLAVDAVSVWQEWMENNEVEPPDIPQQDFGQQIVDSMGKMFEKLPQLQKGIIAPWPYQIAPQVDAEFVPPTADERTSDPNPASQPNSTPKE
jgi:hypothetical protein